MLSTLLCNFTCLIQNEVNFRVICWKLLLSCVDPISRQIRYFVLQEKSRIDFFNEIKTVYREKFKNGPTCVHYDQRNGAELWRMNDQRKNRECGLWQLQIDIRWTFCDVSANLHIFAAQNNARNLQISQTVREMDPKTWQNNTSWTECSTPKSFWRWRSRWRSGQKSRCEIYRGRYEKNDPSSHH